MLSKSFIELVNVPQCESFCGFIESVRTTVRNTSGVEKIALDAGLVCTIAVVTN